MEVKRKKRPALYDPGAPPPLIQILSDQRARLDPSCVTQLAVWLIALRERWDAQSRMTLSGLTGKARKIRAGQVAYAQCMCQCVDALAVSLYETVDARAIDRAHRLLQSARDGYTHQE